MHDKILLTSNFKFLGIKFEIILESDGPKSPVSENVIGRGHSRLARVKTF